MLISAKFRLMVFFLLFLALKDTTENKRSDNERPQRQPFNCPDKREALHQREGRGPSKSTTEWQII